MARQQKRLGEILVEWGIISAAEVARALDHSKTKNLRMARVHEPLQVAHPHAAGIDVHAAAHWVAVPPEQAPVFRSDSSYIITGGLGGIGPIPEAGLARFFQQFFVASFETSDVKDASRACRCGFRSRLADRAFR